MQGYLLMTDNELLAEGKKLGGMSPFGIHITKEHNRYIMAYTTKLTDKQKELVENNGHTFIRDEDESSIFHYRSIWTKTAG